VFVVVTAAQSNCYEGVVSLTIMKETRAHVIITIIMYIHSVQFTHRHRYRAAPTNVNVTNAGVLLALAPAVSGSLASAWLGVSGYCDQASKQRQGAVQTALRHCRRTLVRLSQA
jgi:hypothetical protein